MCWWSGLKTEIYYPQYRTWKSYVNMPHVDSTVHKKIMKQWFSISFGESCWNPFCANSAPSVRIQLRLQNDSQRAASEVWFLSVPCCSAPLSFSLPHRYLSWHKHSLFAHSQNLIMPSVKASPFQNCSFKKLFSVKKKKTHRPWLPLLSLGVYYETESLFHLPFQQGVHALWNTHGACIYTHLFLS